MKIEHIAISVRSRDEVDEITELIRENGHKVVGESRVTGDGYYESVISDIQGNLIELTEYFDENGETKNVNRRVI